MSSELTFNWLDLKLHLSQSALQLLLDMKLPTSSRIQHGRREAPAARPPPRGRPQQTLNLKTVALLALTTGSCCFAAHLLSNDVFDLVVDESQVMVDLSLKHTHTLKLERAPPSSTFFLYLTVK